MYFTEVMALEEIPTLSKLKHSINSILLETRRVVILAQ